MTKINYWMLKELLEWKIGPTGSLGSWNGPPKFVHDVLPKNRVAAPFYFSWRTCKNRNGSSWMAPNYGNKILPCYGRVPTKNSSWIKVEDGCPLPISAATWENQQLGHLKWPKTANLWSLTWLGRVLQDWRALGKDLGKLEQAWRLEHEFQGGIWLGRSSLGRVAS